MWGLNKVNLYFYHLVFLCVICWQYVLNCKRSIFLVWIFSGFSKNIYKAWIHLSHLAINLILYPICGCGVDPITLRRIRIPYFTSVQSQILILLLIKVMRICDHWFTDSLRLHFEHQGFHYERPLPSISLFWATTAPDFKADPDLFFTLLQIKIQLPKIIGPMHAYPDPDPQPCSELNTYLGGTIPLMGVCTC